MTSTQQHRCAFCNTVIERLPDTPGIPINCCDPVCSEKASSALKSIMSKGIVCCGCGQKYEKGHRCPDANAN